MKKTSNTKGKPEPPQRKTVVLPDDARPTCGTMMKATRGTLHTPVDGEHIAVLDVPHFRKP
ncbi:MAG: hypothetical protein AB7G75_33290 [Candidatus Binatia bacterium]